jgi:hypothetical protein
MAPTPNDEALAREATRIAQARYQHTRPVTKRQIVSQRKANRLPVLSDRRPGRNRATEYGEDAAEIAAGLAVGLHRTHHRVRAGVAAFGLGAPLLRSDQDDSFQAFCNDLQIRVRKFFPVRKGKRSERWVLGGRRQADDPSVVESVVMLLLGWHPFIPDWLTITAKRLGFDMDAIAAALNDEGWPAEVSEQLLGISIEQLRVCSLRSDTAALVWARQVAFTMVEFCTQFLDFVELTGEDGLNPVQCTFLAYGRQVRLVKSPMREFAIALLAPAIILLTPTEERADRLTFAADYFAGMSRVLQELIALTGSLPARYRPSLGVSGVAIFEALPLDQREEATALFDAWLEEHPDAVPLLREYLRHTLNQGLSAS